MPVTAEPKATAIQDTSVENNLGLVHACAHRFKGQWRWVFSAVSTSCQHSSSDMAAGTSTATCLPCSMA